MSKNSRGPIPEEERQRVLAAHNFARQFQPITPEAEARIIANFRARIGDYVYAVNQRAAGIPRHPGEFRGMLALGYEEVRAARRQSSRGQSGYDLQDDRDYR